MPRFLSLVFYWLLDRTKPDKREDLAEMLEEAPHGMDTARGLPKWAESDDDFEMGADDLSGLIGAARG